MAVLKCKMCGGDVVLAADKTFGTCEYCGCTMTFPKVNDDQRAAAFNRGNHFRRIGEFDKALEVYERIVAEDENDAEAHWCCALCRFGIEYVEDPTTYEWLPTCHRASFDSFLEDVDFLSALEHSDGVTRRQYQKDAAKIAEVQRGILATSQNTEPYDVFICYKELDENGNRTRDSILAQEIYYRLKDRDWRVFFSRISLEDVPGTQYEPYIFAALNSALVMVVVGTSAENLNSVWVKNEWSRFLSLMKKDRSKLLIPCYRDMDPYDLPDQLSVLMSYDIGRIGFIQDLIRGVDKVLSAEKKDSMTETVKETVVVQQGGGPNVTALIKRGNLALEDGEWESANNFFDQALNMDAECAEAYLGQGLAEQRCHDTEEYINREASRTVQTERKYIPRDEDRIRKARETYPVEGFLKWEEIKAFYEYDLGYNSTVKAQKEVQNRVIADFEKDRYFARAKRFSSEEVQEPYNIFRARLIDRLRRDVEEAQSEEKREITRLEKRYDEFLNRADQKAEIKYNAAMQNREEHYLDACRSQEKATGINAYQAAISKFQRIRTYKDSAERIEQCNENIANLEELERLRIEQEKRIAEEKAEEERKKREEEKRVAAKIAFEKAEQERLKKEVEKKAEVQAAAEKAERERKLREEEWQLEQRKIKRKKKSETIILIVIAVLVGVSFFVVPIARKEANNKKGYQQAELLLNNGDYEAAAEAFANLGDYRDSKNQEAEAREKFSDSLYDTANTMAENGDYLSAISIFEQLGDYRESREKIYELQAKVDAQNVTNTQGDDHLLDNHYPYLNTLSSGNSITVGVKNEGTVIIAGLTDPTTTGVGQVEHWNRIISVSASQGFAVGLHDDGTTIVTDYLPEDASYFPNGYEPWDGKELNGVNDWSNIIQIDTGPFHVVGLHGDGTVISCGINTDGRCNTSGWSDIVQVAAGGTHTVGLRKDGSVVAVGNNANGQCKVQEWTDIISVSAASTLTVGLRRNGTVVTTGKADYLKECEKWSDIIGISSGLDLIVGLKSNGTVVATPPSEFFAHGQDDVSGWTDVVAVSAGYTHTVGLLQNGTVIAVGSNDCGECNVSDWSNIMMPDQVSEKGVSFELEPEVGFAVELTDFHVGDDIGKIEQLMELYPIIEKNVEAYEVGENDTIIQTYTIPYSRLYYAGEKIPLKYVTENQVRLSFTEYSGDDHIELFTYECKLDKNKLNYESITDLFNNIYKAIGVESMPKVNEYEDLQMYYLPNEFRESQPFELKVVENTLLLQIKK